MKPNYIIQLDNEVVEEHVPELVHKELAAASIDYKKVQTLVTISILPTEQKGDRQFALIL